MDSNRDARTREDLTETEQFAPSRLSAARKLRAMKMNALAAEVGVSASAITQFEAGGVRPDFLTLQRITNVLDFPMPFFLADALDPIEPEGLTFRARRSMTATMREKMASCSSIAGDIISPAIRKRFVLPNTDLSDLSAEGPELAAEMLRKQWRLGQAPIHNMVHLLEAHGVEVYWVAEDCPAVDAFSFWQDNRPYVMLNSRSSAGDRGRFDAAHELGHLVLHSNRDLVTDYVETEQEAHRFAAAFLLPELQFRLESPRLPVLSNYFPLKKRWKVSIAAMVRRSRDIGVFTQWQYQCLCKEIATRGWRMVEPVTTLREESQIHHLVFEKLSAKQLGAIQFAHSLFLPIDILNQLMPVACQYATPFRFDKGEYGLEELRVLHENES